VIFIDGLIDPILVLLPGETIMFHVVVDLHIVLNVGAETQVSKEDFQSEYLMDHSDLDNVRNDDH